MSAGRSASVRPLTPTRGLERVSVAEWKSCIVLSILSKAPMEMVDGSRVCVLLPTLNEAPTVETVISGFRDHGFENILVIDGGSTDGTPSIAAEAGARVVTQSGRGKGQAVREAVTTHVESEYILMADADATYRPAEGWSLVEPVVTGDAEHVIGNRFADMSEGAMTRLNKIGNALLNRTFAFIHGRDFEDILSGYRAFTRESFRQINPHTEGFGIETELSVGSIEHGQRVRVVPVHYDPRPTGSTTKLRPFRDGGIILLTLYRLARTNNPLFYFGSVGTVSTVVGAGFAAFVGYRWFAHGISHEVLAVVAAFGILFGVHLLMFGLLSDLIVKLHRQQMRRLDDRE